MYLRWLPLCSFALLGCSKATSSETSENLGSTDPNTPSEADGGESGGAVPEKPDDLVDPTEGEGGAAVGPNPDAFWQDDPPLEYCGPDNVEAPQAPGGTPECPDDKNREGCPCDNPGEEAACWPGLRKNRDIGVCKDGKTTCNATGEFGGSWGPCEGYVLPTPGATVGAEACQCFSEGIWAIENLSPCFIFDQNDVVLGATSDCEGEIELPLPVPFTPWSDNTVTVDCAGHFSLCYTLKAGDPENPQSTDCTLTSVCTEADYLTAGTPQGFPALAGWATTSASEEACAAAFVESGGYGEMRVVGASVTCDDIPDHVFLRVPYCPLSCNDTPNLPECKACSSGGSGKF